jgi:hypothetical protein
MIRCIYGPLETADLTWLKKDSERKLIVVDEQESEVIHPRLKKFVLESPLQIEMIAKKVAWSAVFKQLEVILRKEGALFQQTVQECHQAADLLLSEAADYGTEILKNARANQAPFRRGRELQGEFKDIPAIVVGAGPSLKKNGDLLRTFENKALILAGGSALNLLKTKPHFAASIDKQAPNKQFKKHPYFDVPFCYQARMNRENFSLVRSERLLFPDGSSPAINWLQNDEALFDGGWTVGNFLTAFAVLLGCNPIIFVGMDLCQENRETQKDWLMAKVWTEQFAKKHSDREWINATEGGLGFGEAMVAKKLEEVVVTQEWNLRQKVDQAIQKLPLHNPDQKRFEEWDLSMQQCAHGADLDNEIVYEKLLIPLWQVWEPLFAELGGDLKLHRTLFFQQVIMEHLNA